jgi:hypothetical protein
MYQGNNEWKVHAGNSLYIVSETTHKLNQMDPKNHNARRVYIYGHGELIEIISGFFPCRCADMRWVEVRTVSCGQEMPSFVRSAGMRGEHSRKSDSR